jgi:hypothetical protein
MVNACRNVSRAGECLADQNGGLYVGARTGEDLLEAPDKTLGFGHATTFAT